jgi:exodeoxyribonuclease VII large subunit
MSTMSLFDRPGLDEPDERVLRVSEINRAVRLSLERDWSDVWVEGELSDVTRAASGHVYFTLADERDPAQIRGVLFRNDARRAQARLARGSRVRIRGSLSLYEPRGAFQLIGRTVLPAGDGDLRAQFERIREKLEAEGLFAPERKRPLPRLPRVVGVVTSQSGAALHDVIRVAKGRCPVRLVVSDCRVQGDDAPRTITRALERIQRLPDVEVVIVTRGGGSAEELWAFNDEAVARAMAACRVPVVSGVGHEVDVTIADLVADARASTPSNAAEVVVPDRRALVSEVDGWTRRLERALDGQLAQHRLRLARLSARVSDPRHGLSAVRRRLESLDTRLHRQLSKRLANERATLTALGTRLARRDPRTLLARDRRAFVELSGRLEAAAARLLERRRQQLGRINGALHAAAAPLVSQRRARLAELSARLDAMSPLKVLGRGYAIALHERTGKAVMRPDDAPVGDRVALRLAEGSLTARVETHDGEPSHDGE